MRYYKFFVNPDTLVDIDDAGVYKEIKLPKNGGIIADPKWTKPKKLGAEDRSGLYFADAMNAWYYMTYGDYVAEVFPIPGEPMLRCMDTDSVDNAFGWYAPRIRIGPIHEVNFKFLTKLVSEGTNLATMDYDYTWDVFNRAIKNMANHKWADRLCQAILVGMTKFDRDEFDEMWDIYYNAVQMFSGADAWERLYPIIADEKFDISYGGSGFGLERLLKQAAESNPMTDSLGRCIHMYLLRLRKEHPVVHSACVDFPQFDEFVRSGTDPDGFTHLIPRYYGHYDNWRVNRRSNT